MPPDKTSKPHRGLLPMEGPIARRYAALRRSDKQMELYQRQAGELTAGLAEGAAVLEVAPGPGYLAIEMARPGRVRVVGLDASRTFVELASAAARESGVRVEFRAGDAADMPFDASAFDLVVSQAAFKNFARPARALEEMYRVLRPGGTVIIQDMSRDASPSDIAKEVRGMGVGRFSAAVTKLILGGLRRRAYSAAQFRQLVADSSFRTCEISAEGIGLELKMSKPSATT
ncbi:MAG TPA: class I SAM-dependent methyltransferase [Acidimicrobiales bacterium]|nr:class I SAM-dependent methyltransferase [Acidimicrobiales bacterium]